MYEVSDYYGSKIFETETDAVNVLLLLAPYHDIEIEKEEVMERLAQRGHFEAYMATLSIKTGRQSTAATVERSEK